ncbi:MAG: hypothetical protein ACI9KE_001842 [Polyangiales bacterium]|jgi:hypothetical protein
MKTPQIACLIAALSLTSFSVAEAQSEAAAEVDVEISTEQQEPAPQPEAQAEAQEPMPQAALPEAAQQEAAPQEPIQQPAGPQVHLRFRSIRIYAGAELQIASVDTPSAFETICELPCNADIDAGVYHLNVRREDGREYALPTSIDFDVDTRISLKYGASTGAWVGGIVALTGILGVLISGGIAIAGAANDDSGQTTGGLIGLGLSSAAFGAGLVTFVLSERGLRAEVLESN